jgi:hypothetical protein
MGKKTDGVGRALVDGLRLSSDAQFERDKRKEADRAAYRRCLTSAPMGQISGIA